MHLLMAKHLTIYEAVLPKKKKKKNPKQTNKQGQQKTNWIY